MTRFMMPESGTSRADFPGGSTEDLWNSLRAILDLPGDTRLYIGHDYPGDGAAPEYMATVAEHRLRNRHVKDGIGKAEFIATREARDATLPLPGRMLAALQVNIRGGRLPEAEADGHSYLCSSKARTKTTDVVTKMKTNRLTAARIASSWRRKKRLSRRRSRSRW